MTKRRPAGTKSTKPRPGASSGSKTAPKPGSKLPSQGESTLPAKLQQHVLDVFRDATVEQLGSDLDATIQKVKQYLYDREFAKAFGSEDLLWAYAARWSSSRALAYLQVFQDIFPFQHAEGNAFSKTDLRITCLGGGAGAELVASAAWTAFQAQQHRKSGVEGTGGTPVTTNSLEVRCVDVAPWKNIISRLDGAVKSPLSISKYASAAAQQANVSLISGDAMTASFLQHDLLDANFDVVRPLFRTSDLITIMFTLNELYSISMTKTQRFLLELTLATSPGTLFLVVDSPGSYSTVSLNGAQKKYPMQWLLDHTLLEETRDARTLPRGVHWQKLLTDESRWFRLSENLQYPIELENMRYQIHLYRRLDVADASIV